MVCVCFSYVTLSLGAIDVCWRLIIVYDFFSTEAEGAEEPSRKVDWLESGVDWLSVDPVIEASAGKPSDRHYENG